MIPKGNLHAHGGRLATYITKGEDGEQAELIEMRGFAATDLREAFCDIQAIAESQTQCEKPFFHAYVRLPADETLTRDQWLETANRIEAKLGFDDQPRGVALHFLEDGTTHMHVAWSRIDTDAMKAIDPGLYLRKMKEVCRELEVEYGLRQVSSDRAPERLTKEPKRPEFEEARRLGVDVEKTRETIRDCYSRSDNGPSFKAALAEHGFAVAQGDRRDFVVIDAEGGKHALGKSICGETAEQIRQRFGADFKRSLPTVPELTEQMQARQDAAPQATPARLTRDEIKAEVTALWAASDTGRAFITGLGDHGYNLGRGDRRDFVLIDRQGDIHALPRMIEGARTADVREKLRDIDPASLPTVADAKALTELAAAAREQTLPHVTPFDRDAADRIWQARVNEAGISSGVIGPTASPAREARPLSRSAGEIRLAWGLTQSGAGFAAALEDRGLMLAAVSREEADASQRIAAFARQVGNFAPSYVEGDLVVVNGFGTVIDLTERTTGDSKAEIATYLATVDRSPLLNITDARDVMREASRASFAEERAKNRPPTRVESLILGEAAYAADGMEFVARLGAEGLTLAEASATDLPYLRAEFGKAAADEKPLPDSVLKISEGELVAVNRFGGIHRLNPHLIDVALCAALIEDCGRTLPNSSGELLTIQQARDDALGVRASQADYWQTIRAEVQAARDEAARQPNMATGTVTEAKADKSTAGGITRATDALAGAVGDALGKVADAIGDIFAPPTPLTAEQMEANERAAQRQADAAAPMQEARALSEDEERRAAIAKAQAAMEDALRQSQEDQDKRRDDYGYERTR